MTNPTFPKINFHLKKLVLPTSGVVCEKCESIVLLIKNWLDAPLDLLLVPNLSESKVSIPNFKCIILQLSTYPSFWFCSSQARKSFVNWLNTLLWISSSFFLPTLLQTMQVGFSHHLSTTSVFQKITHFLVIDVIWAFN